MKRTVLHSCHSRERSLQVARISRKSFGCTSEWEIYKGIPNPTE